MNVVHVVMPDSVADPMRPSGGNVYDRHVCHGLAAAGWQVREHLAAGDWPDGDVAALAALADTFAAIPDGALVLIDGLIASAVPEIVLPAARRLPLAALVHMPLGEAVPADDRRCVQVRSRERAVLGAAAGVIATSGWTRGRLVERYGLPPDRVHVAEPGAEVSVVAPGTPGGGRLLCVAAVTRHKGHDVLLAALAAIADRPWQCTCVGSVTREPSFVDLLHKQADAAGLGDRVTFVGPRVGADLDRAYAGADAVVLASRAETYGMVVTEGLARALPVVATAVGGVPEALGRAGDGRRPGLLVPPADSRALAAALRDWLRDPALRRELRLAALDRRRTLPAWSSTTERIAQVLTDLPTRLEVNLS